MKWTVDQSWWENSRILLCWKKLIGCGAIQKPRKFRLQQHFEIAVHDWKLDFTMYFLQTKNSIGFSSWLFTSLIYLVLCAQTTVFFFGSLLCSNVSGFQPLQVNNAPRHLQGSRVDFALSIWQNT